MNDNRDGFDVRTLAATFHAGTVLPVHAHPWGQLIFASSGVMQVMTDQASWLVPCTRAIWMPAGIGHGIRVQGELALRTLYLDGKRAAPLPDAPRVIEVTPLLRELILHILTIGMLDSRQPSHERLAGLLLDLLMAAHPEDLMLPLPADPRARRLADRWLRAPDDGRDLAQLAAEAGASLRTLQRLFPDQTGLTLEAWRQKARLIHAVTLLSTGASVAAAALDCGYLSPAAFSAAFSRQFGVSPGRYGARTRRRGNGGP
ncbi:helix-turn-helix transcriptional regulator [Dyella sp. C11]|uniref:AraC family transcriptional regulator n=1 Tax=Dyella sp. C11 TaxID=2126991 RepID=UPI000D65C904|nr:helix-turn-helix transcriptional regulator [Dyella sp. C11]